MRHTKHQMKPGLPHLWSAVSSAQAEVKWDSVETLKYADPLSPRLYTGETEHDTACITPLHAGVQGSSLVWSCLVYLQAQPLFPWGIQLCAVLLKRKRDVVVTLLFYQVQGWKRAIGMGWWQEIAWAASVTSQANGERACRSTKILPLDQAVLQTAEELFTCSADCLWPIWIWRVCLPSSLLWSLSFLVKAQRCY